MVDLNALGPLGFGAGVLGNLYRAMSDAQADATLRSAWDAGIRMFDTAPHYGFGLSEKRLGATLPQLDPSETAIVSTKIGRILDPVPPGTDLGSPRQGFVSPEPVESAFDYSYDAALRSFDASRARLRRDRIDIVYAHDIGRATHGDDHDRQFRRFIDGGYRAMRELRDSGAVGAIGLGVNEIAVCEAVLAEGDLDIVLLAGRYTLLEQEALASFLPLCARRGVRILLGAPYNSGILASGVRGGGARFYDYAPAPATIIARVAAIERVCDAHGVPLAAAALQFPLAHPQVAAILPGMRDAGEVAAALRLMRLAIPAALWDDLKSDGLLRADAPVPAPHRFP